MYGTTIFDLLLDPTFVPTEHKSKPQKVAFYSQPTKQSRFRQETWEHNHLHFATDDAGYTVQVDCPGLSKEDIKVQLLDGNLLSMNGVDPNFSEPEVEKSDEQTPESTEAKVEKAEYPWPNRSFHWETRLSRDIDLSNIKVSVHDGVATLRLPKVAPAEPMDIQVN
jgi:HSP20 family molecular chaperone IbpA